MNGIALGMTLVALFVGAAFVTLQFLAGNALQETPERRRRVALMSAVGAAVWMALWFNLASSGFFRDFDARPPRLVLAVAGTLGMGLFLGLSPVGKRLAAGTSVGLLVLLQGFRLPLELVMHAAATEKLMPAQMSYSGLNFDVVTGASALVVGTLALVNRAPKWLLWAWLGLGFTTLITIVSIAVASTPMFRAFGTAPELVNTWIADAPYIWLPTVMVTFALAGQLVIARKLLSDRVR